MGQGDGGDEAYEGGETSGNEGIRGEVPEGETEGEDEDVE